MACPKCGSENVTFHREESGNIGVAQNSVTIEPTKQSKGCLYWCLIGWWWKPIYWICIGWWWRLFFGGKSKKGHNYSANKNLYRTIAICQDCGHTWKTK